MRYFSELKNIRVVTESGIKLGKLTDLVFLAADQPTITKIVVSGKSSVPYIIPIEHVRAMNSTFTVADTFTIAPLAAEELYINKNLLDQQIIDIKGNKVVRVNDVAIQDKPNLIVAGVDIGIVGILRWFGADETFGRLLRLMGKTVTSQFLSWADIQPLALSRGEVVLKKDEKKLASMRPEDLADHLETMSIKNSTRVLDLMDETLAADVVENLNISYQTYLFKLFTPARSAKLIARMDADEAVDILLTVSPKRRDHIINLLTPDKQQIIRKLLDYSGTPIGGMLTTQYFTALPQESAMHIKRRIQHETRDLHGLHYIYAVNSKDQLVGVATLHELILQASDTPLYKFMSPSLIVLHLTTPIDIAVKRMLKYQVEALPVTDDAKKLLGIVPLDDLTQWLLSKV